MALIALSLGSNLGDRRAHLRWALERLEPLLSDLLASSLIETDAIDVPEPQPPYLNAAVVGKSSLAPRALLDRLLQLERERGRERTTPRAARTLDLDLVLYDDWMIEEPGLTVPHPRFRRRRFVLAPLAEIAPDLRDPHTGRTVRELLAALDRPDAERAGD